MSDEINEVEKKDFVNQLENHKGEDVIDINIGNIKLATTVLSAI